MNDIPADIFIYAIIAAGLIFWLRNILGTRHGEERQRDNFYSADKLKEKPKDKKPSPKVHNLDDVIADEGARVAMATASPIDSIESLAKEPKGAMEILNDGAKAGLMNIAMADKNFDVKFFLTAAQDAFAMIVEGYAKGDRDLLKMLLASDVYKAFDGGIAAREERGETQMNEILSVRKAAVRDAKLSGKKAQITVRFEAEQISTTHDKDDKLIAGHPDKASKMVDVWVFERSVNAKDPSWLLIETRSDDAEDNDLIPDTDGGAKPKKVAKKTPSKAASKKKPATKKKTTAKKTDKKS